MNGVSRLCGLVVLLALGACGDYEDEALGQSSDEMRLPSMASFAPRRAASKQPRPIDEQAPSEPQLVSLDEVRETGFVPAPGADGEPASDCIDCVRETGFLPPLLELVGVAGGFAELRWEADSEAERFRVLARRLASDGSVVRSDEYIVTEPRAELPLEGYHTVARVEVVDRDGKAISKPSNAVDIPR